MDSSGEGRSTGRSFNARRSGADAASRFPGAVGQLQECPKCGAHCLRPVNLKKRYLLIRRDRLDLLRRQGCGLVLAPHRNLRWRERRLLICGQGCDLRGRQAGNLGCGQRSDGVGGENRKLRCGQAVKRRRRQGAYLSGGQRADLVRRQDRDLRGGQRRYLRVGQAAKPIDTQGQNLRCRKALDDAQ